MTNPRLVRWVVLAVTLASCEQLADSSDNAADTVPAESTTTTTETCEHGLTATLCTRCHPNLVAVFQASGDWCAEHQFPQSLCPVCASSGDAPLPEHAAIEGQTVRLGSPDLEVAAGIATERVTLADGSTGIECTARITFDQDRLADVRAIVPGVVSQVRAALGATVSRGTPLFQLESAEVGRLQGVQVAAQSRLRAAQADLERQRQLHADDIASSGQLELADLEFGSASAEANAPSAMVRVVGASRASPTGRYTLVAPIAGTLVSRPGVVGLLAVESQSLATIADTSVMWVLCDVHEHDASSVHLGQRAVVTTSDAAAPIDGEDTHIAAEVDPRTRTVAARIQVANEDGRLRANQYAHARIATEAQEASLAVPRAAIQRVGDVEVVFVRTARGVYSPRVVVRTGAGDIVNVRGRIRRGDAVVTTGAVLLRTEILPGSIGAGCCEVDSPGAE